MTTTALRVASILAVSIAGGCLGGDSDPALATAVDEMTNSSVVPIGELEAVGVISPGCTATLITDTLVLTSGHCICRPDDVTDCFTGLRFTLKQVRPVDDPATPANESLTRRDIDYFTTDLVVHPDFSIGAHSSNDVAVVRLAQPASSKALVTPIPIDFSLPTTGSAVTIVGWGGLLPSGQCGGAFEETKRRAATSIAQVIVGAAPGDITLRLDTTPAAPVTCNGDSGGPVLNALGKVVGTITGGGSTKAVFAYLEWIALQANSPGNRVAAWDLSGTSPVASSDYRDVAPDHLGLLGWVEANDVRLAGDFFDHGADQILYINRGGAGGKLRIAGYEDGLSPTESFYWEDYGASTMFNSWIDANDAHLVGDFLHRGYDQLLLVNRGGSGGRLRVVDFSTGTPQIGYSSTYTSDALLNGWADPSDALLAGDFRGLGHDQLMLVNRDGTGGRVLIVDLQDGVAPANWVYVESYSDGVLLNGWHDAGDLMLAGDFRGLGRDQVMFINRGAGAGRVLITDFGDGWLPAEWMYYEAYGQSTVLDGYHDSTGDVALAGDFRATGHDQVAFVNRNAPWFGRVLVADFADGAMPATIAFAQTQAQSSPLLQRIDPNDLVLAADLAGAGHPSLITIEGLEQ